MPNLSTNLVITNTITSGVNYIFKIFARNIHGDGVPSDHVTIIAATVPATMNPVLVSSVS